MVSEGVMCDMAGIVKGLIVASDGQGVYERFSCCTATRRQDGQNYRQSIY